MGLLKMYKTALVLLYLWVTFYLTGCSHSDDVTRPAPTFESVGLDGHIVYRLAFVNNTLQAATDRGLYRLSPEDQQWYLLGGLTHRIVDWADLGQGHWLVSVADGDDYEIISSYAFYESLNDGASWTKLSPAFGDFSSPPDEIEPILRLLVVDKQLYATGYGVLARSDDAGRTWMKISGDWQAFATGLRALAVSTDQSSIWYGGQGGFENIVLGHVRLADRQEQELGELNHLLPQPSTVKEIRFDPFDAQRVFVTAEGGIIQSDDSGKNWAPFLLNDDYRFHFDLIADELKQGRFYTAGWSKITDTPQPLILDVSSDNGEHWQHYRHLSSTLFGGVYSLTSRLEAGERVIYVGLFKGGVMRISNIP